MTLLVWATIEVITPVQVGLSPLSRTILQSSCNIPELIMPSVTRLLVRVLQGMTYKPESHINGKNVMRMLEIS
jgi:hypothetical protein